MKRHVMVFGTFDLLHDGHRFLIREAQRMGRVTIVVARSTNVKKVKGFDPNEDDAARMMNLRTAFPQADVILGDPANFLTPIQSLKPDLLLLGYDQRLPPGITEVDLGVPFERAKAHKPEMFKSSLMRQKRARSH